MGKRRLTNRQLTRLKTNQAKRCTRAGAPEIPSPDTLNQSLGPEQGGLLIAHYGTTLIVENQAGQLFRCGLRQNLGAFVTGDNVIWQQIDEQTGVVVAGLPRRSIITRPDRHQTKPMVANVDCLAIVIAFEPLPKQTTLDRYLIIAETLNLPAIIVVNKCDLAEHENHQEFRKKLESYETIGYPQFIVSSSTREGLPSLENLLKQHTSVFVGQSGVGKSSLLNALIPDAKAQIGELSKLQRLGRHTTTASSLYHLGKTGHIIDSPGIHQFNLHHFSKKMIIEGFKEFRPFLGQCKFRNCEHLAEPDCALQIATKMGKIAPFRLQSYHTIISDIAS